MSKEPESSYMLDQFWIFQHRQGSVFACKSYPCNRASIPRTRDTPAPCPVHVVPWPLIPGSARPYYYYGVLLLL